MPTNTPNASIRLIIDRIVDILNDYMDPGDVFNPTDGNRPVQKIAKGWPVPERIPYNLSPSIWVHADSCVDVDEYVGAQAQGMTVTFSIVENIIEPDLSIDHIYDYIDELRKLCFVTHRKWKREADADLGIKTTKPGGWMIAPVYQDDDHFMLQADMTVTVVRNFDFY